MIESPTSVTFRMTVAPSDVAMLVGKSGRMARTLLTGLRRPGEKMILLDIVEDRVALTFLHPQTGAAGSVDKGL